MLTFSRPMMGDENHARVNSNTDFPLPSGDFPFPDAPTPPESMTMATGMDQLDPAQVQQQHAIALDALRTQYQYETAMSTRTKVLIGVGVLAAVGGGYLLLRKKGR